MRALAFIIAAVLVAMRLSRPRGPFQVRYGLGDRPWTVVGPSGVIGSYDRKDAAKHRAWVVNIRKEDQ